MNLQKFKFFMGELSKFMFQWEMTRVQQFLDYIWPSTPERTKSMHIDE